MSVTITIGNGFFTVTGAISMPGGNDTNIQYNNAGAFAGSDAFTFTSATNTVTLGAVGTSGVLQGASNNAGSGQSIFLRGGPSTGAGNNGGTCVVAGGIPADGNGGAVTLAAANGVGTNRSGGAAALSGGNATGTGAGGAVTINAGTTADNNGASITITARPGVGTNRAGGNITLNTGAATGTGAPGTVIVGSNGLQNFANDAAAATGGIPVGGLYRNGSVVQIRVT